MISCDECGARTVASALFATLASSQAMPAGPCFHVTLSLMGFTLSQHATASAHRRTLHRRDCGEPPVQRAPDAECVLHRPYSWSDLMEHSTNQSARYAAGEYPGRSPEGNAMYERYKRWCVENGGISNAAYVLKFVLWDESGCALEPSLAPYLLEAGIEHWILWHHPDRTPGDTELNSTSEARLARSLIAHAGAELDPRGHLLCYQNVPALRSIPSIAHSHVFLYASRMPTASQEVVREMRERWRLRSPWLQATAGSNRSSSRDAGAVATRRARRQGR